MLSGFVIRRFIGAWVLFIKSLGLVFLDYAVLSTVPRCSLWIMVRQRRPFNPCCMLLRQPLHQILRNIPYKRRFLFSYEPPNDQLKNEKSYLRPQPQECLSLLVRRLAAFYFLLNKSLITSPIKLCGIHLYAL